MEKGEHDLIKQLIIKLSLLSPIVVSDSGTAGILSSSQDIFSGTMIRGILANEYIRVNKLKDKAHEDAGFQRLFYGKVSYLPATLWDRETKTFAISLPRCLQKSKDGNTLLDLMYNSPEAGFKGCKGYGIIAEGKLQQVSPEKSITLHVTRNPYNDKNGKVRLAGKSLEGNIYNYESINAGQVFAGSIIGNEAELKELLKNFPQSFVVYAGKSKYTQYGSCRVELGRIKDVEMTEQKEGEACRSVVLRLATPYIPAGHGREENQDAVQQLVDEIKLRTGQAGWKSGKVFAAVEDIDNFVGIWHMRRPKNKALAAGTVIELLCEQEISPEVWEALLLAGWQGLGIRRAEGFGQVRLWQKQALALTGAEKEAEAKTKKIIVSHEQVKEKALEIMLDKLLDCIRNKAYEDARSAEIPEDAAHALSRMSDILGGRPDKAAWYDKKLRSDFCHMVNQEFKDEKYFYRIKVRGTRLSQILENTDGRLPYHDVINAFCRDNQVKAICDALSVTEYKVTDLPEMNIVVYTYYHWLLRHMRKEARL